MNPRLLITAASGLAGGIATQLLLDPPWLYAGVVVSGLAAGLVGLDFGRSASRAEVGYVPPDPEMFEKRIEFLRGAGDRFNEEAYRRVGPDRYWRAVLRERDRQEVGHGDV